MHFNDKKYIIVIYTQLLADCAILSYSMLFSVSRPTTLMFCSIFMTVITIVFSHSRQQEALLPNPSHLELNDT